MCCVLKPTRPLMREMVTASASTRHDDDAGMRSDHTTAQKIPPSR